MQAAHLLLSSLPATLDPHGFAIPPPLAWEAERCEASRRGRGSGGGSGDSGGRGVPLRLVAQHPDVAWEVDGQLQLLIGAAKRTGDPSDVW